MAARRVSLHGLSQANGMQLTHDGRLLIVAAGTATAVLRVSALETGRGHPVAGLLTDSSAGQFEVSVSGSDRYVFVSDEISGTVSVFDLARALRVGFSAPGVVVRTIHLAYGTVGLALSPNGALLYVTTFGGYGQHGLLWVIDTARAEQRKAPGVVLTKVSAGCQPVRVQVAPDGREVWVTALQSNALLAYSATALREHRSSALQAVIRVGSEPVGLALVDGGRLALVANSNRGLVPGSTGADNRQSVSVIDTGMALAHRRALIGNIRAGLFPRDLNVNPATRTVLLANFTSRTIQVFQEPSSP